MKIDIAAKLIKGVVIAAVIAGILMWIGGGGDKSFKNESDATNYLAGKTFVGYDGSWGFKLVFNSDKKTCSVFAGDDGVNWAKVGSTFDYKVEKQTNGEMVAALSGTAYSYYMSFNLNTLMLSSREGNFKMKKQ